MEGLLTNPKFFEVSNVLSVTSSTLKKILQIKQILKTTVKGNSKVTVILHRNN